MGRGSGWRVATLAITGPVFPAFARRNPSGVAIR
jgi:hypothetical protein